MTSLLKEVKIHSSVSHKNIIQLFGTTEDENSVYLVMEFAAAGELFDRIAPDIGLEEDLAHLYFTQLLSGMEYIHERGIAHRDLKPEASDFGRDFECESKSFVADQKISIESAARY
jgi:serine/threonine-protein kinase Chk1